MKTGISGLDYYPEVLEAGQQHQLLGQLREIVGQAPLFQPVMPRTASPFSVMMTNMGPLGWVSDVKGYRYQNTHPVTGQPWPAIPDSLRALWDQLTGYRAGPEACVVNFYNAEAKMGLHLDDSEEALDAPVLSLSLGDTALFKMGGVTRGGPTQSLKLKSGDGLVMGGAARLAYHGIARIYAGTSDLLRDGGRINLTLRRVTPAD